MIKSSLLARFLRHFEQWKAHGRFEPGLDERTRALYRFDEGEGSIVHDSAGSGAPLFIPQRYMILHEQFLETPRNEFYNNWRYWKNVMVNIGRLCAIGFYRLRLS